MPNCSELELQTACRKPSAINRHRQPATVEPQLVCRNVSVAVAVAVAVSVSESRQSKRVRRHKRGPFMLGRSLRSAQLGSAHTLISSHLISASIATLAMQLHNLPPLASSPTTPLCCTLVPCLRSSDLVFPMPDSLQQNNLNALFGA